MSAALQNLNKIASPIPHFTESWNPASKDFCMFLAGLTSEGHFCLSLLSWLSWVVAGSFITLLPLTNYSAIPHFYDKALIFSPLRKKENDLFPIFVGRGI